MDNTERKITKIAREANRFTVQTMKEDGIGTAEMDVIHFVRHNPGTTQKEMWEALKIDKGATARRVARLEEKATSPASRILWTAEVSCSTPLKKPKRSATPRRKLRVRFTSGCSTACLTTKKRYSAKH